MATIHTADRTNLHRTLCGREVQTLLQGARLDSPRCQQCQSISFVPLNRLLDGRDGPRLATVKKEVRNGK
jgi:hypothetical protein